MADVDDVVKFIATCPNDEQLGNVAGALMARMVHKWGKPKTLAMLDKLIDAGRAARDAAKKAAKL